MAGIDRFYDAPKGPQVQPDTEIPRNAHYNISSSPDMFGALIAKGLSQVGQGLTDAYNVYGQVAADQATNNFLGKLTSLRTDFEQTRGQDTINSWRGQDGSPGYPEKAQAAFDEARATVPPGHQNAFDNVARRYLFASNSAGDSHFRTQSGEWAKTVSTTKDQEAINSISSHPNDDATFETNVYSMEHAATAQAQIAYGIHEGNTDPDAQLMLEEARANAVGRAWYARIEAVRPTNPQQANQWAKDHEEELGKLGPKVQQQMRGYMGQAQTVEWDKQAEAATAGGGPVAATPPDDGDSNPRSQSQPAAPPLPPVRPSDGAVGGGNKAAEEQPLLDIYRWFTGGDYGKEATANKEPFKGIVIHATGRPDLQSEIDYMSKPDPNRKGYYGYHFLVDRDGKVYQTAPFDVRTNHIEPGGGLSNNNSLGVAFVGSDKGTTPEQIAAGKRLVGILERHFGIPETSVVAHGELDTKTRGPGSNFNPQGGYEGQDFITALRGGPRQQVPAGVSDLYFHPDTLQAYKERTAQIENPGGNPYATSSAGATGKYQFIRSTWDKYGGGGDIHGDQEAAMDRLTMDNAKTMSYALGRAPQLWELYLGHQQGPMGAYHLLTEPNRRAGDIVGDAAIRGNGGDPNAPASAFTALWHAKFGNMRGGPVYAGGGQSGDVTVAAGPHMQFTGPPSDPLIRDLMATPSATGAPPFTPASPQDLGGSGSPPPGQPADGAEGQQVQPVAYQPVPVGGGGGGGMPDLKQPGTETVPPQPSPFISAEEREYHEKDDAIRRKMLWVINNHNIPNGGTPTAPGKTEMLAGYERQREGLMIGYHQDAEYRKYVYNQTRSSIAQFIDKGDYRGAVKANNDALAQNRIDEQGWATMGAVIQRRSGDPDIGALGPGSDVVLDGIRSGKINSFLGIDEMYETHQIGWAMHQRAIDLLNHKLNPELSLQDKQRIRDIEIQDAEARKHMQDWFKWSMQGPTVGTSIPNPNGQEQYENFLNDYLSKKDAAMSDDPYLRKFDFFDGDKLQKMLEAKYPERARREQQGMVGMTTVSAEQAAEMEKSWAATPHPAPPPNTDPSTWNDTVAIPPILKGGVQMPHPYWDKALRMLVENPSPSMRQFFDRQYGPEGVFANGRSSDDLLREIGQKRPADAPEGERSAPAPQAPAAAPALIKPHPSDAPFQIPFPRATPAEQLPDDVRRMFPELNR